jgi:hypothetical protein
VVVVIMALVPGFQTATWDDNPGVPATLAALRERSGGRPVVVEVAGDDIGPELPGLMVWASRGGMRVCISDPRWVFITTDEFVCDRSEIGKGLVVARRKVTADTPEISGEIARLGYSAFTTTST